LTEIVEADVEKQARKVGSFWTFVAVVCAVATGLAQSPPSHEGQSSHQRQPRADGITVHGHWTIDVRNPDGALASHHEFENALEPTGATALSALLARNGTLPSWQLDLIGASGGPCISAPVSGDPSIFIGLAPLAFDPQTNLWGAGLSPLLTAPYLQGANAAGVFQLNRTNANSWTFMLRAPNGVQISTASLNGPLSITNIDDPYSIDPVTGRPVHSGPTITIGGSTGGSSPGTYFSAIDFQDPVTLATNTYQIAVVVPSPQPGIATACTAVEANTPIPPNSTGAWFPTLTVNQIPFAVGGSGVEFAGNVTVTSADAIDQVRSLLVFANTTTRTPFSARALPTPIQVVAGQQVFVKVLFTFS
jgi:hypothetical protein